MILIDCGKIWYYNDYKYVYSQIYNISKITCLGEGMPKVYSENEKEYIRQRLKEEAANCMALYGLRKTTVDELVKRVHIPKGTFYLFYESKELLMFEALNELHESVEKAFIDSFEREKGDITVDKLTDWITTMYLDAKNSSILKLMESGDIEVLMRKLPSEVVEEHMKHDQNTIMRLANTIPGIANKDLAAFTLAFQGLFVMLELRKTMTENEFEKAMRLMIRGIVIQLLEEETR